jgi:hypothetical protein
MVDRFSFSFEIRRLFFGLERFLCQSIKLMVMELMEAMWVLEQ